MEDEIKIGDEVIDASLGRGWANGVVTLIPLLNKNEAYVMWFDGSSGKREIRDLRKTGKHIDGIAEVLKQLERNTDDY